MDQRGLSDPGGRGDHVGGEQKGKRAGAADEFRPDEAHHRLAWDAERKRDARLGGDDPESDLAHLLRYGDEALFGNIAGDDRTEERLEAGLQILRQRGDTLRPVINAVDRRRRARAEGEAVKPERPQLERVGDG